MVKEIGGGEKRSGSTVVADDPAGSKKHRSELVAESIVETDYESESDEEPKIQYPMPDKKANAYNFQMMNEYYTIQRGLKWVIYRLMVGEDDKEKFISSMESLKKDYDKEKSLIDIFEGPPKFVMVAVEANTLKAKSGAGISEIVDQFYGVSDVSQISNQAKVTAQLLFSELEVVYLLNRRKIQRLAVDQHCTINIYTSGYPSCDPLQIHEDMMVHVEGRRDDVCTTLVQMFLCVDEEFRYSKQSVHSMAEKMRNLPSSGVAREVYLHGRDAPKLMASYDDDQKGMIPHDHLFFYKPYCSVYIPRGYADLLTREKGKLIESMRGPPDAAEFEVRLTDDYACGSMELKIVGLSADRVMRMFQEKLREVGEDQASELVDIVGNRH